MRIYVDVDGTLTKKQTGRSFFKKHVGLREEVIAKVKEYSDAGHEIIIWTGNTGYAERVATALRERGIIVSGAVGKPHMMIDNEVGRWTKRLRRRMVDVEDFLGREVEPC